MKVIWSKESLDNLLEIENYISQDSPEMAIEFTDYLIEQAKYLTWKIHVHSFSTFQAE